MQAPDVEPILPPPPARRALVGGLRLAALVVVLGLVGLYLWRHWDELASLGNLMVWTLVGVALLNAADYVWNARMIQAATRPFGVRLGIGEAFMLSITTRLLNVVTPLRGGAVARALYLNRRHNLSYPHFLAGMAGMLVLLPVASVGLSLVGLAYLFIVTGQVLAGPTVALLVTGLLLVWLMAFRPRVPSGERRIWNSVVRVINGWGEFCQDRWSLVNMLIANCMHVLTQVGICWLILHDMGTPVDPILLLLIVAVSRLSTIIMITPGNIGVYEGMVATVALAMGVNPTNILAATLAWRVIDVLMTLIAGPISLAALDRRRPPSNSAA